MRTTTCIISAALLLIFGGNFAHGRNTRAAFGQSVHKCASNNEIRAIYKMRNTNDVVMYLSGTTPVKNWQMQAHGLRGEAQLLVTGNNELLAIEGLTFSLPVRNLKGEVEAMDQDAYNALKADRFKEIQFTLSSAKVSETTCHEYLVKALGRLSVAGVTRIVTLTMHSKVAADGSIAFQGSESLKMSDYNVERPSVLFGVIKAADEMTLTYSLIFSR